MKYRIKAFFQLICMLAFLFVKYFDSGSKNYFDKVSDEKKNCLMMLHRALDSIKFHRVASVMHVSVRLFVISTISVIYNQFENCIHLNELLVLDEITKTKSMVITITRSTIHESNNNHFISLFLPFSVLHPYLSQIHFLSFTLTLCPSLKLPGCFICNKLYAARRGQFRIKFYKKC